MKYPILVIFFISIAVTQTQSQAKQEEVAYLDSVKIDLYSTFIHPANIVDIQIDSKNRALYIYSTKSINFLTLDSIGAKYVGIEENQSANIVYIVDDKLIKDKSKIKIDSTLFLIVKTYKLDDVTGISKSVKKLTIVDITLSAEKSQPKVRLRGEAFSSAKENN